MKRRCFSSSDSLARSGAFGAALFLALALVRCGGSTDVALASNDAAAADSLAESAANDAPQEATSDGGSLSDADANRCSGVATFDLPSEAMAQAICHAPSCKVCVQSLDENGQPDKWAAWQIPQDCPCPKPTGA